MRNGPGRFNVGSKRLSHWFDGIAMLHAFRFENGRVSYKNRFLDCGQKRGTDDGRIDYAEFATDPCRSWFAKLQGMDTAGKGGLIKALTKNVNASGVRVFSFKKPSDEELDHPALWRTKKASASRGIMTFYDRSDYEEVLIVKVHPEILDYQRIPNRPSDEQVFLSRYQSIAAEERDLAHSGIVVCKFWLNTTKTEQAQQLLERIDDPKKHWKLSAADFAEREHWDEYKDAAQEMMRHTSRPWAPWYCIPGDDKQFARYIAADITVRTLQGLNLQYPELSKAEMKKMKGFREELLREIKDAD